MVDWIQFFCFIVLWADCKLKVNCHLKKDLYYYLWIHDAHLCFPLQYIEVSDVFFTRSSAKDRNGVLGTHANSTGLGMIWLDSLNAKCSDIEFVKFLSLPYEGKGCKRPTCGLAITKYYISFFLFICRGLFSRGRQHLLLTKTSWYLHSI